MPIGNDRRGFDDVHLISEGDLRFLEYRLAVTQGHAGGQHRMAVLVFGLQRVKDT